MRKFLFIFITLFMLVSSCINRPEETMHRLLKQAERMLHTAPDTAYYLLQRLADYPTATEEDSTYRGLLLMEARIKNGMKLTDTVAPHLLSSCYLSRKDTLMQARALRLSAVAYRDLGHYDEAVAHYNAAIALAKAVGGKRLFGDAYSELARLHNQEGSYRESEELCAVSKNMYRELIPLAASLKDTVLWINTLLEYQTFIEKEDCEEAIRLNLKALELATETGDKAREAMVCFRLSVLYGKLGLNDKEKSFAYSMRSIELKKGVVSMDEYYFAISMAYRMVDQKDSADFYSSKAFAHAATKLKGQEYSAPFQWETSGLGNDTIPLSQRLEQMKWNDEFNRRSSGVKHTYWVGGAMFLLVVVLVLFYLRKRHTHSLRRKEQEIADIRHRLDSLAADTDVFGKIDRIVRDCLHTSKSSLRLEKSDWDQLMQETGKRYPAVVRCMQESGSLTEEEMRICCLHLTEYPVAHLCFLLGCSRASIYRKSKEILEKLHASDASSLRDFLKETAVRHG